MAHVQDHSSALSTHVAAGPGASRDALFPRANGSTGAGRIIEVLGHPHMTLQTRGNAANTPTVLLEASNDATNWKVLATHAHAGNDDKFTEIDTKAYRFVRVNKSVDGDVDYFLRLAGASGPF